MGELLDPTAVRALADRVGLRPTKQRGQNFVVDTNTVRRLVALSGVEPGEVVLEIGPGLGSLTLGLLAAGARVVAVELDAALAAQLPLTVAERAPEASGRLCVIRGDALRLERSEDGDGVFVRDGAGHCPHEPTALVANLPYNVAVPVLIHALTALDSVHRGLVMVQAEVADRLVAPPGSRVYGVPSAKLAWFAGATRAGSVSRSVFWPVPNVESALVRFDRTAPPVCAASRAEVFAVVDAAFAQRRKMLRTALAGLAGSGRAAIAALEAAGVDPTARGETLDIAAFARIADGLR